MSRALPRVRRVLRSHMLRHPLADAAAAEYISYGLACDTTFGSHKAQQASYCARGLPPAVLPPPRGSEIENRLCFTY